MWSFFIGALCVIVLGGLLLLIASFIGDAIDDIETGKDNDNDV